MFEGRNLDLDGLPSICFCFRISAKTSNRPVFLSSNLDARGDTNVLLKIGEYDDIPTHIDERCFIESALGDQRTLRSLIHREHFVSYNNDTEKFVMKKIPMNQYRAYINGLNNPAYKNTTDYISAEEKLSDCLFEFNRHYPMYLTVYKCGRKINYVKNIRRINRVSTV